MELRESLNKEVGPERYELVKVLPFRFLLAVWVSVGSVNTAGSQVIPNDFDDNIISPSLGRIGELGFGSTIEETNQQLEITIPRDSGDNPAKHVSNAEYISVCQLVGDYGIQVDFKLLEWPPENGVRCAQTNGR